MSDVTDGLRVIVARPSNYGDKFLERQMPIEGDTQHFHILSHRKVHDIHVGFLSTPPSSSSKSIRTRTAAGER